MPIFSCCAAPAIKGRETAMGQIGDFEPHRDTLSKKHDVPELPHQEEA
jgi:hypothetical protein